MLQPVNGYVRFDFRFQISDFKFQILYLKFDFIRLATVKF